MGTSNRTAVMPLAAALLVVLGACDDQSTTSTEDESTPPASPSPSAPGSSSPAGEQAAGLPSEVPSPDLDPADFVDAIDNPYLPLVVGSRWVYQGTSAEGEERVVVTVTDKTRLISGVRATVVRDQVFTPEGELLEDTFDWFAQDVDGNVWYLGEDTTAFEGGKATDDGSWEAGVDGAMAGLVMPAQPQVGQSYQEEFYEGEAEDRGKVLAVDETVKLPVGTYENVVKTEDTTPLEPNVVEHKYYASGVGQVYEEMVSPGDEVLRLMRFDPPPTD